MFISLRLYATQSSRMLLFRLILTFRLKLTVGTANIRNNGKSRARGKSTTRYVSIIEKLWNRKPESTRAPNNR